MSGKMTELDAKLDAALRRRQALGVVDIKCHVDVSATTDPQDFKRALVNVFEQDEAREVLRLPLSDVGSFADLYQRFRAF